LERGVDLESWEFGLRSAVLVAGARLLEKLIEGLGSGRRAERVVCECGSEMESVGRREKRIKTVLGEIIFRQRGPGRRFRSGREMSGRD